MSSDSLPGTRARIAALIPHQGAMCLLDSVVESTADHIVCRTRSHASPANPLRRNGRLSAVHLCEYGAQAMAVHGGLAARSAGRPPPPGFLVALRDVQLAVADVEPSGELEVRAQCLHTTDSAWQYHFDISRAGQPLASGRATVMLRGSQG
jgi:predicted hotdog family 3-hydroxylacyl-ACP dehydratase